MSGNEIVSSNTDCLFIQFKSMSNDEPHHLLKLELLLETVVPLSNTLDQSTEPNLKPAICSIPLHNSHNFDSEIESFEVDFQEANSLLNIFREDIYPKFPFVKILPSVSAEDLHRDRPFLYISIMA